MRLKIKLPKLGIAKHIGTAWKKVRSAFNITEWIIIFLIITAIIWLPKFHVNLPKLMARRSVELTPEIRIQQASRDVEVVKISGVAPVFLNFPKGQWMEYKKDSIYQYIRGQGVGINTLTKDHQVIIKYQRLDDNTAYWYCRFDKNHNVELYDVHDDKSSYVKWFFTVDRDVRMKVW